MEREQRRQRKSDIWYDLDNAANIFPAISNDRNTNVFRIACVLRESVDREALQKALDEALKAFGYFQVVMRRGLFWLYLERTDLHPQVTLEAERPCNRLFYLSHKTLLFSLSYYRRRINLEVFHAVSDGTGALQFLQNILYRYLRIVHKEEAAALPPPNPPAPSSQAEDSFLHHYNPDRKTAPTPRRAYTIGGTMLPRNSIRVICGDMPTKQVLALAKERGVTVTAYLSALMICAVYTELMPTRARRKPIGLTIPVDLRNHFPSDTARNFFGVTDVSYTFDGGPADFDAVLQAVSAELREKLRPEALAGRFNYTMSVQKNVFARAVPVALKNLVLRAAYNKSEHATTCALSNLGRIALPTEYDVYVERFDCLLNPTPIHRVKACVCSYGSHFVVNFTSCIAESKVEKYFFRHMTERGVDVLITCNGGDESEIL